jgi:hypothetical protein
MTDFKSISSTLNKPLASFSAPATFTGVPNSQQFVLNQFGLQALRVATFNDTGTYNTDDKIRSSVLGNPVLRFAGIEFPDYGITIDNVLVSISQSKNIVKTSVQGRNGTIKEYISDNDYEITLRGVIIGGSADVYPENEASALIQMCQVAENIRLVSAFVQLFGITKVVIESYDLPQTEGTYSVQAFQISCSSDEDLLIEPENA